MFTYTIKYDSGKPLYLVGKTTWNQEVYHSIKKQTQVEVISLEELENKSDQELDSHQYFCSAGFLPFKLKLINAIRHKVASPNFVSLVSNQAIVHDEVELGRGVLVCPTALITGPSFIGDFCTINHYTIIGHGYSTLKEHVFTGAYVNIANSILEEGTWIGSFTKLDRVTTCPYTQFYIHSRIKNHKFTETGTYKNKIKMDERGSLDLDIN